MRLRVLSTSMDKLCLVVLVVTLVLPTLLFTITRLPALTSFLPIPAKVYKRLPLNTPVKNCVPGNTEKIPQSDTHNTTVPTRCPDANRVANPFIRPQRKRDVRTSLNAPMPLMCIRSRRKKRWRRLTPVTYRALSRGTWRRSLTQLMICRVCPRATMIPISWRRRRATMVTVVKVWCSTRRNRVMTRLTVPMVAPKFGSASPL